MSSVDRRYIDQLSDSQTLSFKRLFRSFVKGLNSRTLCVVEDLKAGRDNSTDVIAVLRQSAPCLPHQFYYLARVLVVMRFQPGEISSQEVRKRSKS